MPSASPRLATYERDARHWGDRAAVLEAQSRRLANGRGLAFAGTVVGLLSAGLGDGGLMAALAGVAAFVVFLVLVVRHDRVLAEEDLALRRHAVNLAAAARCTERWPTLPVDGLRFRSDAHAYSGDLDLFGPNSLFQRICVAQTAHGQRVLAGWMTQFGHPREIVERQQAVRCLSAESALRRELEALCLPTTPRADQRDSRAARPVELDPFVQWAESTSPLTQVPWLSVVAVVLPPLSLAVFALGRLYGWPLWSLLPTLLLQLWVLMSVSGEAQRAFGIVSNSPRALRRFEPCLSLLEKADFTPSVLRGIRSRLVDPERGTASAQMRGFDRIVGWFELRHNAMVYPLINWLLLWDVHCLLALERWKRHSGQGVRRWLEALGEFEALSSLAAVADDNPDFCFPDFGDEGFVAEGLAHPLVAGSRRVANDLALPAFGTALLVTGSNMSGKSTLLRAMGLALVMAHTGGPVCARSLKLGSPALFTSMRISDSLSAGVSHFYAELQKLERAVRAAREGGRVFFLLDEILHGTNSEERQVGARWVLETLLRHGAIGAVSTHDLGLCRLPPELADRVTTVHLRETVEHGKMVFDYRVRPGPVTGGNALRLMRTLGLDVPLVDPSST